MPFLNDPECETPEQTETDAAERIPAEPCEGPAEPEHEEDHSAPTEPDGQPGPGTPAENPTPDAPAGKLPPADDTTGQPNIPTHPRDESEEALLHAFLYGLRSVRETAVALSALHDGASYSHVVNEARVQLQALIGRAEGSRSPDGAGA